MILHQKHAARWEVERSYIFVLLQALRNIVGNKSREYIFTLSGCIFSCFTFSELKWIMICELGKDDPLGQEKKMKQIKHFHCFKLIITELKLSLTCAYAASCSPSWARGASWQSRRWSWRAAGPPEPRRPRPDTSPGTRSPPTHSEHPCARCNPGRYIWKGRKRGEEIEGRRVKGGKVLKCRDVAERGWWR